MICQCYDKKCPIHKDKSRCDKNGTRRLMRIDLVDSDTDRKGVVFCKGCGEDAVESGVFRPANT